MLSLNVKKGVGTNMEEMDGAWWMISKVDDHVHG